MTAPIDALVAEAIEAASLSAWKANDWRDPFVTVASNGVATYARDVTDSHYVRRDVVDAALAHLATRAAEAEGRAERAEARIVKLRAALDGAAERAGHLGALSVAEILDDALCIDVLDADQPDAEKEAGRG